MSNVVESGVKGRRAPFTLHAFVVLAILIIVIGPIAIWGILAVLSPDQVSSNPPGSEAVTISAITGLIGWLGGQASSQSEVKKEEAQES